MDQVADEPDQQPPSTTDRRPQGAPNVRQEIDRICRKLGIADLYAFGSRGKEMAGRVQGGAPTADERLSASDVDIGIRPLPGVSLDMRTLVDVAGELERLLDVPRVDVVSLPSASPYLALEVIRGELLYSVDPHGQAEFELYVLKRAGDLAPFQRLRQELALSRYVDR